MDRIQYFLTVMAALSAASHTITEHVIKNTFAAKLLSLTGSVAMDRKRTALIHLWSALTGSILAYMSGLRPLSQLLIPMAPADTVGKWDWSQGFDLHRTPIVEYIMVGIFVSFGGSLFNEMLDTLKAFKGAQQSLQKDIEARTPVTK